MDRNLWHFFLQLWSELFTLVSLTNLSFDSPDEKNKQKTANFTLHQVSLPPGTPYVQQ